MVQSTVVAIKPTIATNKLGTIISAMWTVRRDYPHTPGTLRLRFYADNTLLSYLEFIRVLERDSGFRDLMQQEMRAVPFIAFRWETPPLTATSVDQPFECLLHDSPELDVPATPSDFRSYFRSDAQVVSFENLGTDALLIVPCPISESANYSHIGAFHRTAPDSQQHALWIRVAQSTLARLSSQPLWLNTAGGGVDWLHMRLDTRPKYYRHLTWRDPPADAAYEA